MKKILSILLSLSMLASTTAVVAVAEDAEVKASRTLLSEDFEDKTSSLDFVESTDASTASNAVSSVAEADSYGKGSYSYSLSATGTGNGIYGEADISSLGLKTIEFGKHTAESDTYGYAVETSFDWDPDDTGSWSQVQLGTYNGSGDNKSKMKSAVTIRYKKNGNFTVYNRTGTSDATAVTKTIGSGDVNHTYRVRIVITPYAETVAYDSNYSYNHTVKVIIDGVTIREFGNPRTSAWDCYLYGLRFFGNNSGPRGVIDNVKIVDYWNSLTTDTEGANAVEYVNDDELVSMIRTIEADESMAASLSTALSTAKAAHTTAATQAAIDSAVTALANAVISANKKYTVLNDVDFESGNSLTFAALSGNETNTSSEVAVPESDMYYDMGSTWYDVAATNDNAEKNEDIYTSFENYSQNIYNDATVQSNNYVTELSFDYKTTGNSKSSRISVIGWGGSASSEALQLTRQIASIKIDASMNKAYLYTRTESNGAIATINLADYTAGYKFIDEVNRYRLVFATDTTAKQCIMKCYINGIEVYNGTIPQENTDKKIAGLRFWVDDATDYGFVDNIEMIEYDDTTLAKTGASYANRDKLVAAIRGAACVKSAGVEIPDNTDELINSAKTIYTSETSVTADMNSVADTLNSALADSKSAAFAQGLVSEFAWIPDVAEKNEAEKAQNAIYGDLYLPSTYLADSRSLDITWSSDNEDVINSQGYITAPMTNTYVTLTANFTDGTDNSINAVKTFKTRVLAGGNVILNSTFDDENRSKITNAAFVPQKSEFMVSVSGKAGEYTFTLGGAEVKYTFTEDGDYDVYFNATEGTYDVYQNCEYMASGSANVSGVEKVSVDGNSLTHIVGIDLNLDKAFVTSVDYVKGDYTLGAPVPGSSVSGVKLRTRDTVENATAYVAVFADDGSLYAVELSDTINVAAGEDISVELKKCIALPEGDEFNGASVKVMLWDTDLTPLMQAASYAISELYDDRAVVYMIGDSTMCNYEERYYPRAGWGQMFDSYFDENYVKVDNHAVSGRTTKWFKEKGAFDEILSSIKPGDYLIMQFGHNDQKEINNVSLDVYKENLKYFADSVKEKGAIPIIASSISRRSFNDKTLEYDETIGTLGEYPNAAKSVADAESITFIDLYAYSAKTLSTMTDETSKQLYCFVPNTFEGYDESKLVTYAEGYEDNTHFSEYGANIWAKYAASCIKDAGLSISSYVVNLD